MKDKQAELLYLAYLRDKQVSAERATRDEDRSNHIDVFVKLAGGVITSVDVKGWKSRTTREPVTFDSFLVEWQAVLHEDDETCMLVRNNRGWVRGDAEFIVFILDRELLKIRRTELLGLVEHIDWTASPEFSNTYPDNYRVYRRADYRPLRPAPDRDDLFCYVPRKDIDALPSTIVQKIPDHVWNRFVR